MPTAESERHADEHELLVSELGRITSELAAERRLTAMVAHDLATPVQVIIGLGELILDDEDLPRGLRTRVEQILRSADNVAALVGDLRLGLSPSQSTHLDLEAGDLVEVVAGLVDRSRVLAATKEMRLELEIDLALGPCTVAFDQPRLERALTNLVGNAIKFGPSRTTVLVGVERLGDVVRVTVRDEGPGVDAASSEVIFDVFHREERTAHLPGLGLGLYISRQIIEAHGGSVSVETAAPAGAAFVVHLPVAEAERYRGPLREN